MIGVAFSCDYYYYCHADCSGQGLKVTCGLRMLGCVGGAGRPSTPACDAPPQLGSGCLASGFHAVTTLGILSMQCAVCMLVGFCSLLVQASCFFNVFLHPGEVGGAAQGLQRKLLLETVSASNCAFLGLSQGFYSMRGDCRLLRLPSLYCVFESPGRLGER